MSSSARPFGYSSARGAIPMYGTWESSFEKFHRLRARTMRIVRGLAVDARVNVVERRAVGTASEQSGLKSMPPKNPMSPSVP